MNKNLPVGSRIIGLDLSKKSYTGCILSDEGFVKKNYFNGKMTQDDEGWKKLCKRIRSDDLVLMEAGTSSFTLARYLKRSSVAKDVIVLNPGLLRVIWMSQKKNDKSDAAKIACVARDMQEEAWPIVSIPTAEEQSERSDITLYVFFKQEETQLINKLYALYNSLGFPEISRKVLRELPDERYVLAKKLLASNPSALDAAVLLMEQLDLTQLHIEIQLDKLRKICLDHPKQALSWFSIPGIGLINAATLIAYIGEGSRFSNAHQLLNYAGLIPKQDQSGSVDKHLGITHRGNAYIRRNIVQGGWVVSLMKPNCPLTKFAYRKMKEGKQKQKVAIAVANKMLRTGLALLHSGELYHPMIKEGYEKLEMKLRGYKAQALMKSIAER
ncbi:MAG: IS110 family transposase [Bacteroidetes bacterium]|nr:IS110 family transposase [Bacteroidota bacterium]